MTCLNDPVVVILAGGIAVPLCILYTLWRTAHPKGD